MPTERVCNRDPETRLGPRDLHEGRVGIGPSCGIHWQPIVEGNGGVRAGDRQIRVSGLSFEKAVPLGG